MEGVSGPGGPSEEPREDQRAGVQRGKTEDAACSQPSNSHARLFTPFFRPSQGIVPPLRKEVWKFLLGFYPWNSTAKEREEILRIKTLVFLLPNFL